MEAVVLKKMEENKKSVERKKKSIGQSKRNEKDGQYPSRSLLPETLPILLKKWEVANADGGNVVKQKHIIHRAVELISDEELRGLREKLVTPKIQFNERFLKWRGSDGTKTVDDFKAYLLGLMEKQFGHVASEADDLPNPFEN